MKIVKYIGGLGNQMFIYAFSVALRETFQQKIYSDTHYYKTRKFHNGLEIEKIFNIHLHEAKLKDIFRMAWYFPNYWIDYHILRYFPKRKDTVRELKGQAVNPQLLQDASDKYYEGYWQSYEYFDNFRNILLDEFAFAPIKQNDSDNYRLSMRLGEDNASVGIHIRRGDYLKNRKYIGLCGIDYYKKAIDVIKTKVSNPHFYLFSDDIEWVKENIFPLLDERNVIVVNWNGGQQSYKDMQLMSMCKNLIIANSSFSWWAAYLNKNSPIVIAPEKWINMDLAFRIQYKNWITL